MKVLRLTDALTSSILYPPPPSRPRSHPPFPPPHFHIARELSLSLPSIRTGRGNPGVRFTRDNWLAPTFPL